MRALCLLLALIAGNAWADIAPNTTGLYDLEGNLTDSSGLGNNGTLNTTVFYTATNPWHGSQSGGGGGIFTIPNSVVGASGSVEFSFIAPDVGTTKVMFSIATAGGTRTLEIYHSTTNLYMFSNSIAINNIIKSGLTSGSKVYVKTTWNGTTWKTYAGDWTTAGTVTLTEVGSYASPNTSSPTTISVCGSVPISNGFSGYLDWVRVRNVYDPTTTVTVDPSGASSPLSPYMKNTNKNWMMPKLYLLLEKIFTRPLYALESDCKVEQARNVFELSKADAKIKKDKSDAIAAKLADDIAKGKTTYTVTPSVTPTRTPSVTPTRTPVI